MTERPCAECGAPQDAHSCVDLFHAVLALDHSRLPPWGPLHPVTVGSYFLQHSGELTMEHLATYWSTLHIFLEHGSVAVQNATRAAVARRSHRARQDLTGPVLTSTGYPLPSNRPAPNFAFTIHDLAGDDGTFPAEGFEQRLHSWVTSIVDTWRDAGPKE